ncbi:M4 family metallopeptidase [Tenacibaculum amylolyticum]|uniref:M4 family metallopeptidase n=1 Tax=Tenacibaculum amylolyticum TaxID=104269 RepID=UPI003894EC3E
MKTHNHLKKVFFASFLVAGLISVQAQERKTKHIKVLKSSKEPMYNASKLIREKLKLTKNEQLQRVKTETDDLGFTHEKYQQRFKGLNVEFATYKAHAKKGLLTSMNGKLYDVNEVNIQPKLNNQQAFNKALQSIGAEKYLWETPKAAKVMGNYKKPVGELVILPSEVIQSKVPKLAYKFDIYAVKPLSRGYLYIDATTGEKLLYNPIIKHARKFGHLAKFEKDSKVNKRKVLETLFISGTAQTRYSGAKNIDTRKDGNIYTLNDESRKVYTRNANKKGIGKYVNDYTEFVDNDNNWTTAEHKANKDNAALDAHWGAMMTYDYFKNKHNRDSFDGEGTPIRSYVHVGINYDNAFWDGTVMSYGDGSSNGQEGNGDFDALTSIDIAAHEIGHAVCSNTADLLYQRESGALNEGFSDIWGAAVEHFAKGNGNNTTPDETVWLIGDEIDRRSGSNGLRSMSNPNAEGQPDTYGGKNWIKPNCPSPAIFNDYCGVHTNSGVLNYWFYLLVTGGDGVNDIGNNYTVKGIGMSKAAKITYRLESVYLSPTSNFNDAKDGAIAAAADLYGDDSKEVQAVINAWYAVGVGDLCFLPAPKNLIATVIKDNIVTLKWNAVSNATTYTVKFNGVESVVKDTSITLGGLEPGTEYTGTVKANCLLGGEGAITSITIKTTGIKPEYCVPVALGANLEFIGRVQLGTIDNESDSDGYYYFNGYSDYTTLSTKLQRGETNTIAVTPFWTEDVNEEVLGVWIDYNHNNDFDDEGEQILLNNGFNENGGKQVVLGGVFTGVEISGNFTVPANATVGATRMRVLLRRKAFGEPKPCLDEISYGEVEDYTVVILDGEDTEAPEAPTNLIATNLTDNSFILNWDTAVDNIGVVSYVVYQDGVEIKNTSKKYFLIEELIPDTKYSFTVKAIDGSGNESVLSKKLDVTTLNPDAINCSQVVNISVVPYEDGFESSLIWHQALGDDGNWSKGAGKTHEIDIRAGDTGPKKAAEGYYFMYMMTTYYKGDFVKKGTKAILESSCINLNGVNNPWFTFRNHMYGLGIGTLKVQVNDGDKWIDIWSKSGDQGNQWNTVSLDLKAYINKVIKLRIVGVSGGIFGDIALDDLVVINSVPDTEAPSIPTNLVASNITHNSVVLNWDASTDNKEVVAYDVYRWKKKIGTTTTTSFKVENLIANGNYGFSVKAVDHAGNVSEKSKPIKVKTLDYCISKSNSSRSLWINYVGLKEIKNKTKFNNGYGNFTAKKATLNKHSFNNELTVGIGGSSGYYPMNIAVWIDFNRNGVFEANEKVMSRFSFTTGNKTQNIQIPETAKLGVTRMRVSLNQDLKAPNPCGKFTVGEVEDYTIRIIDDEKYINGITTDVITNETETNTSFTLYPNPVEGNTLFVKSLGTKVATYKMLNTLGQILLNGVLTKELYINTLKQGVYVLEINNGGKIVTKKFIKK